MGISSVIGMPEGLMAYDRTKKVAWPDTGRGVIAAAYLIMTILSRLAMT